MKRAFVAFTALVTLLVAGPAASEMLPPITVEKYELPNGLDVILHENHDTPVVAVNIWYHVGSKNEKRGRTGFAHLFEHMMFQGSQHHDKEYFEPLERVGGDANGSTNKDRTNYWENVPSNQLELALWLEADRMGALLPVMTQEKLDNQRDVVKNERRQNYENTPYRKVEELILPLLYPQGHPYAWPPIGSMEDLSAASLEDVSDFFRTYYTPNNASLCIAGDFDPAEAKALVEKYFAPIPAGKPIDRLATWVPQLDGVKRSVVEDAVNLPKLYYAWNTAPHHEPGDAELDLLANVLSNGKTSRLYKALVYEQQIAQDVVAYQASGEIASYFRVEVTAAPGHSLEEIERAVDAELSRILAKGVTNDELAQAKTGWEAGFIRALEQVGGFGGLADQMNGYNTMTGNPNAFQWDLDRYLRATAADVLAAARAYIDLDRRVIMHVVPQGDLAHGTGEPLHWAAVPGAGAAPQFTPPAIQSSKLANGLEVFVVSRPRLPLVQANLVVKSGWSADPAGRPGTAALTAELLDEGTKKRSALEISNAAKALGAQLYAGSTFDGSEISLNVVKKGLDAGMALMSEIVLEPTFPAEEVERQRLIYLGEIAQEQKEPATIAFTTFQRELFGAKHPYAQPFTGHGTEASVRAIQREDLLGYYTANYAPNNAALVMVGDITLDEGVAAAKRAFGNWAAGKVAQQEIPAPPRLDKTRVVIVDKPGAPQSYVVAGHTGLPRNHADYDAFEVMNNVLGGTFTSRMNLNLREDKGYSYGTATFVLGTRGEGAFACFAPVQSQSTKESIVEIVKEMRDVVGSRPLTDQEIADSKNNLILGFPQQFQTVDATAARVGELVTFALPRDDWRTYVSRVQRVNGAAATKAAKDHLRPEALLIVVVGDRAKIEPGLRELNLGEVITVASEKMDEVRAQ